MSFLVAAIPFTWVASGLSWVELGFASVVGLATTMVLIWIGLARALGYRPAKPSDLLAVELVHLSAAEPGELAGLDAQVVHLSGARCRRTSRMLRADRPLTAPIRAVYFFPCAPSGIEQRANVSWKVRSHVRVDPGVVDGPIFARWDGCVAIPSGYHGAAQVSPVLGET